MEFGPSSFAHNSIPVGSRSDHNHEWRLNLADHNHSQDMEELTQPETVVHSNYILYFVLMAEYLLGSHDPSFLLELDSYYNTEALGLEDRFLAHIHIGVVAVAAREVVVQLETNW